MSQSKKKPMIINKITPNPYVEIQEQQTSNQEKSVQVKKCQLSGRPIAWIYRKFNQIVKKVEILPYHSILIKRFDTIGKDFFIHQNFFDNLFNKNSPYAEGQIHKGQIQANSIRDQQREQNIERPYHESIDMVEYLRQFYVVYCSMEWKANNLQQNHNIFYYDTSKISLQIGSNSKGKFLWNSKDDKQQFIGEHQSDSYVLLFYNQETGSTSMKPVLNNQISSSLIIYSVNLKQQIVSFEKSHECNERKIEYYNKLNEENNLFRTFKVTENQMILIFHNLLFQQRLNEQLSNQLTKEKFVGKLIKQLRKNKQQIDQTLNSIKKRSFTRQYNYHRFYTCPKDIEKSEIGKQIQIVEIFCQENQ